MTTSTLAQGFGYLFGNGLLVLVSAAGLIALAARWRRLGAPAALCAIGALGLQLSLVVGTPLLRHAIISRSAGGISTVGASFMVIQVASSILHAIAVGLLVAAIFLVRRGALPALPQP